MDKSNTPVITYYLEMTQANELLAKSESHGLIIQECLIKQFHFNRFLYQLIGAAWNWTDKLTWTDEKWKAYAENDHLRTWVAYYKGSPAGYFELQKQEKGNVKLAYFGLAPNFIGKGFGGYLLSQAIQNAWDWEGAQRVWVHTCSLDHPSALNNYKARGFKLYKTVEETN
jgi:GNAT superfamily N-acetyltransferase